jgi:hypothetical protein
MTGLSAGRDGVVILAERHDLSLADRERFEQERVDLTLAIGRERGLASLQ